MTVFGTKHAIFFDPGLRLREPTPRRDTDFWMLDVSESHARCINEYPASSIKHPESSP